MPIEFDPASSTAHLNALNASYPAGTDKKKQGDDHLRLIKRALKNTFPNLDAPVTAKPAELNALAGFTLPLFDVFTKSNAQNLFLNPAFGYYDGTSTPANAGTGHYVAEQWRILRTNSGGSFTPDLVSPVLSRCTAPGFALEFNITSTLTGAGPIVLGVSQPVEDVALLAGQKVAVSVLIDNVSGPDRTFSTYCIQHFGSGSGASAQVAADSVEGNQVVPAGTVKRLTWHISVPAITTKVISDPEWFAGTFTEFYIQCSTLTAGVFRYHATQLEFVATDTQPASAFTMPSYGEQRASLARYYQAMEIDAQPAIVASTLVVHSQISLAPYMRKKPVLTTFGGTPTVWQPGASPARSMAVDSGASSYTRANITGYTSGLVLGFPAIMYNFTLLADSRF